MHLAPPLLAKKNPETGTPVKRAFGGWIFPVLKQLAKLKVLRGTRFDPFGYLAERRMERLVNPALSGLPAFLTPDPGLHSGFMIAQVTAASLVSENKTLAHPASVDSIPTSGDKEDHVSMCTWAARKAAQVVGNCRTVLAIETMAAGQALEFLAPLKPGTGVAAALATLRQHVPEE